MNRDIEQRLTLFFQEVKRQNEDRELGFGILDWIFWVFCIMLMFIPWTGGGTFMAYIIFVFGAFGNYLPITSMLRVGDIVGTGERRLSILLQYAPISKKDVRDYRLRAVAKRGVRYGIAFFVPQLIAGLTYADFSIAIFFYPLVMVLTVMLPVTLAVLLEK